MALLPTGSVVVVNVAIPLAFNVPVPIGLPPLENVTVPEGVPVVAVTVAVRVTLAPCVAAGLDLVLRRRKRPL